MIAAAARQQHRQRSGTFRKSRAAGLNLLFNRVFIECGECLMLYSKASRNFLAKFDPPLFRVPLAGYDEPGGYDQP